MDEGLFGAPDVFVRMSQIMMRSGIARRNRQGGLVKRNGVEIPGLTVSGTRSFVGKASDDPKARVERVGHQGVINGFAVRYEFVEVVFVLQKFHEPLADFHPLPLLLGYRTGE